MEINVTADNRHARLCVRDQVIGIAQEDQHQVFERFERAVPNGQIIELHGGQVLVESEPGRGSKFTVELPQG